MNNNNECCGTMGRFFGHKYQSMIVSHEPKEDSEANMITIIREMKTMKGYSGEILSGMNQIITKMGNLSAKQQYKIVCERCGKTLEVNQQNSIQEEDLKDGSNILEPMMVEIKS